MTATSSLGDRVRALVTRLAPHPVCDACVADRLGLDAGARANPETRALAGSGGFERRRDICSLCYGERLVIRLRL
ncbi:hypothetical protein [Sphingomonas sp. UYP23]